ncbi:hypothetical protein APUTEX25_001091, partial [Auxenochlorella protothecoides]
SVLLGHGEQGPAPSLAAWLPAQLQTKDKASVEPPGVEAEGDAGLRIAWQYRRYITKAQQQQEGIGTAVGRGSGLGPSSSGGIATAGRAAPPSKPRPWATAFDLRKAAGAEVLDAHRHRVVSLAEAVGRLVFTGLAGGSWPEGAEAGLAPLLSGIRARVRAAAAVALVTLSPAGLAPAVLAQAQHAADAVLALETVASDAELVRMVPDPGSIAGLLSVLWVR